LNSDEKSKLKVVEGAGRDGTVGVITAVKIDGNGKSTNCTADSAERETDYQAVYEEAQRRFKALGESVSARWYSDQKLYNCKVNEVTEDCHFMVIFDGYEDDLPQKTKLVDIFPRKQDLQHRIQSKDVESQDLIIQTSRYAWYASSDFDEHVLEYETRRFWDE
jgi:hypothetical protein